MSTNARGSSETKPKSIFGLSGRIKQIKRRRQGSEEPEKSIDEITSSEEDMGSEEFMHNMAAALSNEKIAGLMVSLFEKAVEKRIDSIDKRIDDIEDKGAERDERIEMIEYKVDEFEQKSKENHVIITGLPKAQAKKDDVIKVLNEKLSCDLEPADILYTLKLGKQDDKQITRTRVVFLEKATKTKVMKKKKELKGEGIWISDELTLRRDKLAFMARQAVKDKHAFQTWTSDGKIFMKLTKDDKPIKISTIDDIPTND